MANNSIEYCPTTIDNPWNPFTQYTEWYAMDMALGYHTLERWARMRRVCMIAARTDSEDMVMDEAIDEMIRLDPLQVYVKVNRNSDCTKLVKNA